MDAIQRRTIAGLSGLVALWVVVYWAWEPRADRGPTVTFAGSGEQVNADGADGAGAGVPVDSSSVQPVIVEPLVVTRDTQTPDSATEPDGATSFGELPFRWVVARDGDTYEKIAGRELGRKSLWTAIARANPLKDPQRLRAGDRVKVPLDPKNPQARPETETPPPAPPAIVEYTVEPNDTLSGIAQKFYGSVRFVDFLYESNRDRLSSPDSLRLGQTLVIPPRPGEQPGSGG
jgi:nucleoid-associated protein YgaU